MKLIPFDENNEYHLERFNYFAHEAGHPEYLVNGKISDSDFDFREVISDKFDLDPCFTEDPDGCSHKLISRQGDMAIFKGYYGTENDQDGYDEMVFEYSGKLYFNVETEEVIFEPDCSSIKDVS